MNRRRRSLPGRAAEMLAWRCATASVLAPLVRALLDRGFRYRDIVGIVEHTVVAAAIKEHGASDRTIAGRTGLSLGTVRRWRAQPRDANALPLSYSAGTRLLSRWILDPDYSDERGPRPLPLEGANSFATLAQAIDSDPGIALRQLKRLGLIKVAKSTVRLAADAYVPSAGVIEKLDILGRDGAEFLQTMIHNVSMPRARALLQRRASYDNIGSAALKALRATLRRRALDTLAAANRELAAADRDRNPSAPGGRRMRVAFGIYFCEEPVRSMRPKQRGGGKRTRRRS